MPMIRTAPVVRAVLLGLLSIGNAFASDLGADPRFKLPRIEVEPRQEVVFEWKTSRCSDIDIPDAPARAFRDHEGRTVVLASHYESFLLAGEDLRSLRRDCGVVYRGKAAEDPALYDYRTWIAATWTDDGKNVAAVGHNEYHAQMHPGRCSRQGSDACWYNSLVLLFSGDGGRSFRRADAGKSLPVASIGSRSEEGQGHPRGFFNPSNIVAAGGYHYLLAARRTVESKRADVCLLRARNPFDISSWEVHDGTSFRPSAHNPYDAHGGEGAPAAAAPPCGPVRNLRGYVGSVSVLRDGRFLALLASHPPGQPAGGVWASVSPDLTNWSEPQLILPLPIFWSPGSACGDTYRYNYPSLLDGGAEDRNFAMAGDRPRLFLVRAKIVDCRITMERDLISMAVDLQTAP